MIKTIFKNALATLLVIPLLIGVQAQAASPTWDTTGTYEVAFKYLGTDYGHDMVLVQNNLGALSGHGGSPVGANVYTWVIASGTVSANAVTIHANYTATADAVTPLTVMHMTGTVATSGVMSGTWSDNYQGGVRSGTWTATHGIAVKLGSLVAEDFGVVSYDTGLGMLKGYTAGFGLTNATFAGVQSVVVKLYSGATLLQTNTATAKVGTDITGNQISSPFDVSGTFNYGTDGYWVNVKEAQYGQSVPATRVVATVTLANGKVVTAENNLLTGDPATIYPVVVPPPTGTTPTTKDQCKNGGWMAFTHPTFKNQGACVSYVAHHDGNGNDDDDNESSHVNDHKNHGDKNHENKSGHKEQKSHGRGR